MKKSGKNLLELLAVLIIVLVCMVAVGCEPTTGEDPSSTEQLEEDGQAISATITNEDNFLTKILQKWNLVTRINQATHLSDYLWKMMTIPIPRSISIKIMIIGQDIRLETIEGFSSGDGIEISSDIEVPANRSTVACSTVNDPETGSPAIYLGGTGKKVCDENGMNCEHEMIIASDERAIFGCLGIMLKERYPNLDRSTWIDLEENIADLIDEIGAIDTTTETIDIDDTIDRWSIGRFEIVKAAARRVNTKLFLRDGSEIEDSRIPVGVTDALSATVWSDTNGNAEIGGIGPISGEYEYRVICGLGTSENFSSMAPPEDVIPCKLDMDMQTYQLIYKNETGCDNLSGDTSNPSITQFDADGGYNFACSISREEDRTRNMRYITALCANEGSVITWDIHSSRDIGFRPHIGTEGEAISDLIDTDSDGNENHIEYSYTCPTNASQPEGVLTGLIVIFDDWPDTPSDESGVEALTINITQE